MDQNGAVQYISPVAQGDNIDQRDGDSIKVQSFRIKGMISRNAASLIYDVVRVLIVRDLQNTGTAPTANDVLQVTGSQYAPYQQLDFLNGPDLNKRFSVILDTFTTLDTYHPTKPLVFDSNHDCHVFFRGTTNGSASAGNGSYWLVAISNATVNLPSVEYTAQIRFTDN